MRRILAAALLTAVAAPAFAQVTTVVEPVPSADRSVITAPIEYDSNGVVKAQYFKAEDLSPEQLAALYAEADRVRSFQQANGVYVQPGVVTAPVTVQSAPATSQYTSIELYEQPDVVQPAPQTSARIHTVAKGDTLYNISKRMGVSVGDIRAANGLSGNAISLGQSLTIPGAAPAPLALNTAAPVSTFASAPVTTRIIEPVPSAPAVSAAATATDAVYAVLPKDTLYAISRRSCVAVPALVAANGLSNANALKPGQKLTIPAGHCLRN